VRESQTFSHWLRRKGYGAILNEARVVLRGKSLTPAPLPEGEGIESPLPATAKRREE